MFIPIWGLFALGFLFLLSGICFYSLGTQNGYAAGLRAFYMVKDLNQLPAFEEADKGVRKFYEVV